MRHERLLCPTMLQAEPVAKKPKKATGKAAATKGGKGVVQVQQTNAWCVFTFMQPSLPSR